MEEIRIVELSNGKKYMLTDSTKENNSIFYFAMEVDYDTELPNDDSKSCFFKETENDTLTPVTNEADINYLMTVFVNKLIDDVNDEAEKS